MVDVGGGDGALLTAVLRGHPSVRGVVFDTPEGLAQAAENLRDAGLTGRCALRNVRRAIPGHGRLLIIEPVLPDTVDSALPAVMYLSDLNMLVNVGGRERTRADFHDLCQDAGFALTNVTPLPAPNGFSVIEAAPA
ncbi:methyltransferase [Spirillospora sp. NBC_00431]